MRNLTQAQKDVLVEAFNEAPDHDKPADGDNLVTYRWVELMNLNDYETLEQDVNRFLFDLFMEWQNSRSPW